MAEAESGRVRRAVTIPGGAEGLARRLREGLPADAGSWFWLDGAAAGAGEEAVSYLGIAAAVATAAPGQHGEFLELIGGHRAARDRSAAASAPSVGFHSGWVAALGYEFGEALLGLDPTPDDVAAALALRADVVVAVSGERGELRAARDAHIDAWLAEHGGLLAGASAGCDPEPGSDPEPGGDPARAPVPTAPPVPPAWRHDDGAYAAAVDACKAAIRDGEAYVLCLTDTLTATTRADPLDLFLELRARGGALRGGLIVTPGRALVSASPERFLSIRGSRIDTHPIKGTRPRGGTPAEDERLAAELRADPKERAENLMIVDLMRNDLSRVCAPGSVAVTGFLRVETHQHVHQLVSTVSGELRQGEGAASAIAACFPGGSMTGAPKRRAIELLREFEAGPRGLYAGCFGWLDRGGDVELAMTIRGVELRGAGDTRTARIGAGGGITADSRPSAELAEKHLKAASLVRALDAVSALDAAGA
ncbi:anthranilate synthase component I family protein [Leucobacter chromiireducens]|uniref:anthranilate synthase component I family protein n=1 Tax=Leucobacter chromiireducens TaxID=283877 RepID=UPI001F151DF2|nr:anthranilate synthase component I family protein [Leucobacter chromiireducens]